MTEAWCRSLPLAALHLTPYTRGAGEMDWRLKSPEVVWVQAVA